MNTEPILDDNSPNPKRSTKKIILSFVILGAFFLAILGFLFFSVGEAVEISRPTPDELIIPQPTVDSVLQEGQEAIEVLDSFR